MEAVPKVPMLHFTLKQTQQKTSFSRLKQYIAECYQEDPETFSKEIYELETLRAAAYNPSIDETGYNVVKRYYCQLHSLQNRFPLENDRKLVNFVWRDIYSNNTTQSTDLRHDMAVVLYNYGALHTQIGATASRSGEEEMKLVCTLFQRAAWAFETIREKYQLATTGDMYPEILIFMQNICFAQAQECILEKGLIDNRKPIIVAKVASQIIEYYNSAFAALLSGGEEGMIAEIVGSRQFKEWRQYIQFKVQYTACILLLYQGQHAEEQQKMGERVTLYQAAFDRLEEARKESKHLNNMSQVNEALIFVMDVVEAKRKAAKNENEFIYHEEVPELSSITSIPGANLVKGLPFNVADAATEDIFHRLVPIKTHEHSSLYSEEKANLLRKITQKIEGKDNELNQFMESLNIDSLSHDPRSVKLPQSIIDRCASMNARPTVIDDLVRNMSSLAEICVDVENMLQTIQELLSKEEFYEKDFQQTMGYRPSGHFVELNREFMKYQEAHNKAGDSNDTLRKAMEMHVNNLRILSKSLSDVQAAIPTCSVECDPKVLSETQMLLNKVNEMRVQRAQLYVSLSENVQKDDITAQLIAWGENDVEKLFKNELGKHEQLVNIIEQNLVAQDNILKTFTDAYAKCAHFIKTVSETKHKRDIFFSSLIASYDVYDDLLGKSLKGLEFYKKLQSNIHKLCARVRSARDVHDEERQQRIDSMNKKTLSSVQPAAMPVSTAPSTDYMNYSKPIDNETLDNYRTTAIRPTPIGQENTGMHSNGLTSMNHDISHSSSTSATVPFNYNYQSTASITMPSNYAQPPAASIATSIPATSTSIPSLTSAYSNPQNTYYNPSFSQTNAYSASSGYVNPIYNSMGSSALSEQMKQTYSNEKIPTDVSHSNSAGASMGMHSSVNNMYASNANVGGSVPVQQYNYNSTSSAQIPQNSMQTLSNSSQPQSYLSYSQSDAHQINAYAKAPYVSSSAATTAAFYSHPSQTNIYQTANLNSIPNQNLTQPQSYGSVSYTDYSMPHSQVNAYQIPMPAISQYSQSQQQQNQQVSQLYTHPVSAVSWSSPQQTPTTSAFGAYSASYAQQLPPTGVIPSTNEPQPAYPASTAVYANNYYGSQYDVNSPLASKQYYGVEANLPTNQYSVPLASGYMTSNYGVTPNTNFNVPNQTNVYNYGVVDPTMNPINQQQVTPAPAVTPTVPAITPVSNPAPVPHPTTNVPKPPDSLAVKTEPAKQKPTKFDLLSDFDNIPIPAPTLQPIKSSDKPQDVKPIIQPDTKGENVTPSKLESSQKEDTIAEMSKTTSEKPVSDNNDSIEKALSELSLAEDELITKPKLDNELKSNAGTSLFDVIASSTVNTANTANTASVPPSSSNIESFYKEVQRYEKIVNGLTTKTLNGTTPLEIKWKELNDLLEKDVSKRTVSVSKLFPEKNRNMLSVPYDHSRVLLPTETDNYINAAHIRDLGSHCNHFILADAPTFNTVKDFWCMIWSQQASHIVCLTTPDEGPILLFAKQLNTAQNFGDYMVTVTAEQHRLYVIERSIQLTSSEANSTRTITVLQPKQWTTKNSIINIIGVSQNIIDIVTPKRIQNSPIILNCLSNLERSSLVALAITCILALESDTPLIINVIDVWYRICLQRKNILNDINILQQSMQIVLQCCREFIKKRSPKTLTSNTQTNYYFIEEEESSIKDPFKDIDPLWKLK